MNFIKLDDIYTLIWEENNHRVSHTKCMSDHHMDGHITNVYRESYKRVRDSCVTCGLMINEEVYKKAQFIVGKDNL